MNKENYPNNYFLEINTIQELQVDSIHECNDFVGEIVHWLGGWP